MIFNLFNKKSSLKKLLREQDNVPPNIKLIFLQQYTASFIKISELRKRKSIYCFNKEKELIAIYKTLDEAVKAAKISKGIIIQELNKEIERYKRKI